MNPPTQFQKMRANRDATRMREMRRQFLETAGRDMRSWGEWWDRLHANTMSAMTSDPGKPWTMPCPPKGRE